MGLLNHDAVVDAVESESAAFAAALAAGEGTEQVPTCPDWTLRDLAVHVGAVAVYWGDRIREAGSVDGADRPRVKVGATTDDLVGWWDDSAAAVLRALRSVDPDLRVDSFLSPTTPLARVARRFVHELAVHRVDAQLAVGSADPIDPPLAADGIHELLELAGARVEAAGGGETIHLHGTDRPDAGDEWLVTLGPEGLTVAREHAKGDLALRGAVGDLELLLYQRPTVGDVDRFGDESVLTVWYDAFTFT